MPMTDADHATADRLLGLVVVASPLLADVVLGVSSLLDRTLTEERTTAAGLRGDRLRAAGGRRRPGADADPRGRGTSRSTWATGSSIPHHYHFSVKFVFDRLSVPFAILSFVLSGTIGAFASKYMHRERGLQPLLRALRDLRAGHGGDLAGRHDRDPVRRLGAGRAVVGLAGRLLPGAARPGAERAVGLDGLPGLGRGAAAGGRGRCTTCAARATSTSCWARARGPTRSRRSSSSQALRGRPAAAGRRGGQVGAGAVLGLAAAGDGRADPVERRVLRRPVGPPGGLPAAAGQPAAGTLGCCSAA